MLVVFAGTLRRASAGCVAKSVTLVREEVCWPLSPGGFWSLVGAADSATSQAGETCVGGESTAHRKNVCRVIWKAAIGQWVSGKAARR